MDVLGGFRSRLRIPLEVISAYAMVIVPCVRELRQGFHSTQPLRVGGHVYAHLPSSIYVAILVGATVAIIAKLFGVVGRFKQLRRQRSTQRPCARVLPGAGIDNFEGRTALFTRRRNFLVALALYLVIAALMTWLIGKDVPEGYIAFGGILVVLALNLLLGVVRAAPFEENSLKIFNYVSLFLAVLATDRDYEDPGLDRADWDLSRNEEANVSETFHRSHGSAVLDIDDVNNQLLYIRGTGKYGMQFDSYSLNFGLGRVGHPVEIDRQDRNFRLIPVRVPFALVWYSIYSAILRFRGFVGADEIDKCALWLILVSGLTAFVVGCIPGPCVVIKDNKQEGSARHDVNREESNLALAVP